jgi:hypothetical protein
VAILSALERRPRRALRPLLASAMMFVGACSFVLDTESLQEGDEGSGGAKNCPQVPDPCANCLGQNCCAQYGLCRAAPKCQAAFMTLEQCVQTSIPAACLIDFTTNGGPAAATLSNCAAMNCSGPCG